MMPLIEVTFRLQDILNSLSKISTVDELAWTVIQGILGLIVLMLAWFQGRK